MGVSHIAVVAKDRDLDHNFFGIIE